MNKRNLAAILATVTVSVGFLLVAPAGAQDGTAQSSVVGSVPTNTPDIADGATLAVNQIGTRILVGGTFTQEANHGSKTLVSQPYLFAFNASTGVLDTGFLPVLDGNVESIEPGPSADTAYVAGFFNNVNGVKSKSIVLLNTTNGSIVPGFTAPNLNGAGNAIRLIPGHLLLGGTFTTANGSTRDGLVSMNPTTGAIDTYLTVALVGHHNYGVNPNSVSGAVGVQAMTVSPDGTQMMVIGNFTSAGGASHDQIVKVDLGSPSASVDSTWTTTQLTAACFNKKVDSYVRDIDYSPDGTYFVLVNGGGSGTNTDKSRSLCDSASRWSATDAGPNVLPTWVDYSGQDTLLSVAVTGTTIYIGGHQRWMNNPLGFDKAGAGAVPRPSLAALDPASGLPLTWNPGRNPRGEGTSAAFASATGVYFGYDQDYIGNNLYQRKKLAYFPLTGGYTPAATTTSALPGNVYETGPTNSGAAGPDALAYRSYTPPSTVGTQTVVANTGVSWSTTRGAVMIGSYIYYAGTDGNFRRASFDGTTVGTPTVLDAYDDMYWDGVQTGSGQTYQGVKSGYYNEINSVSGAFYSDGRLYYTLTGKPNLYWRYFSPDSGIIGGFEYTAPGGSFTKVAGMFESNSTIYYANSVDGTLHSVNYTDGGTSGATPSVTPGTDQVVSSGTDWRSKNMFVFSPPAPNQPPVAQANVTCTGLSCTFDASMSSDPDGTIASYAWNFGDMTTGSGQVTTHSYASGGSYLWTLTVTDNEGAQTTTSGTANPVSTGSPITFVGSSDAQVKLGTSLTVSTPTAVQTGDTELLYVTASNTTDNAITGPSGWTLVANKSALPLQAAVFEHTVASGDPTSVTTILPANDPIVGQIVAYRNVASSVPMVTTASDANTASHIAPAATVTTGGAWVVSFWSDRSSTTTGWALPGAVTNRDVTVGTSSSRVSGALGDSGAPQTGGTYPAQTATVLGGTSSKGVMMSLVLPSS